MKLCCTSSFYWRMTTCSKHRNSLMFAQGTKKTVLISVLHLNNNPYNEQYCFPQIQIWLNTKNTKRMCGHWYCSLYHFGQMCPLFSDCQADPFTTEPSFSKHSCRSDSGMKFSQVMCVFIKNHATETTFEWGCFLGGGKAWRLTRTCSDTGAWARGGSVRAGLNAQSSHWKASQQNYKPEKISVLRHCKQNGFCFLQDNELTRAHHAEQDNQWGRKCYHCWNDAISLSEHLLYVTAC